MNFGDVYFKKKLWTLNLLVYSSSTSYEHDEAMMYVE